MTPPYIRAKPLRALSLCAALTIAGCDHSPQEIAKERAKDRQKEAYRACLYEATGPFGSASIEVVRDCRVRTGIAS